MRYLLFLGMLYFPFLVFGNNIRVNGEARVVDFTGSGRDTAIVEFGVSWDNSWRDDFNWDAAWLFLKYKKRGLTSAWEHAYLSREGHESKGQHGDTGNYSFMVGEVGEGASSKVTGLFLMRDGISEGSVDVKIRLKWPLQGNSRLPLTASDFGEDLNNIFIAAYAVEMVYVPYGEYMLGDGYSNKSFSVKVSSENPLKLVNNNLTLSASYPKGYRGFYAMKYEVSQEQYVEFLNSLTLSQQKNRVMNNDFEHMSKGDYVFGDRKRPNCRNGIAFLMQKGAGAPALFGNNLNPDNKFYSADDGQTLACNYLSPADMLAYCDWSGLRPMSELEYEKSCRRPSPQIPEKGEYAWNSNSGVNRLRTVSDLTGSQTDRETPFDYKVNVNAGKRVNGPVRSGAFATSRTGQQESGATYWGLMEMSGNLWELCYNANSSGSVFKGDNLSYSHGDGNLNANGTTDIGTSYWPSAVAAFGVRGGSFASEDNLLRTSDRTYAEGSYFSALTQRDSSVGFRGVRSMLNTTGFTAGRIYCANGLTQDTMCGENEYMFSGTLAENTVGKTTYSWYMSEDGGTSWKMLEGAAGVNLNYEGLLNTTTTIRKFLFKRKAICSVGEAETEVVTLVVPNVALSLSAKEVVVDGCGLAETIKASNAAKINTIDWYYKGVKIRSGVEYLPMRKDFGGKAGLYRVDCQMNYLKCKIEEQLKVILEEVPAQIFTHCGDQVIDCQGNLYTTAKIGNLCWMTENMNVGQRVPGSDLNTHTRLGIQKICYNDDEENCKKYGALYRWEEAMYGPFTTVKYTDETKKVVQGICPDGWRLPTTTDWNDLITHWSANWKPQLGGFRYSNRTFRSLNSCGVWYATQILGAYVGYVSWGSKPGSYSGYDYFYGYSKTSADGLSVRCVRNF